LAAVIFSRIRRFESAEKGIIGRGIPSVSGYLVV